MICGGFFPGSSVIQNSPNAGATGDVSSIPGSGRSPEGGNGNLFLPGKIPWTEETCGLQSMGSHRVRHE